jgi:phosphoribosylformylglycinamidine synthase
LERYEHVEVSLTKDELEYLKKKLGKEPNSIELAMVDAEWSEHCSYKSSKPLLKLLPTSGRRVILGPGYDAGVLDVDNGYVVTIHIESHNHPSAVDPYGGAATGIGGIVRDILALGTRPIALLNSLRFGRIDESAHSRWLFKYVVKGISDYGNCIGVPTVAGEVEFDESFETNCLVDVLCIGLGRKDEIVLAEAKHAGDVLILVGGRTGRDGIHGVTFASKTLSGKEEDRSAVQIPDPFTKKLIIEATLEAVKTGHIRGLKDLGGGGLTCALSEMADKGKTGLEVELSKVHLREPDMNPIEILISESQERMLFVVEKGYEDEICKIFEKYELPYSIIGRVTSDGNLSIKMNGKLITSIPANVVAKAPIIKRKTKRPRYIDELAQKPKPEISKNLKSDFIKLLQSPTIASKKWVYEQYDHEVGIRTVIKPGGDAAVLRLPNGKFIAVKVDGNSKHSYLNPYYGAAGCLAEGCRNVICVGAEPIAYVDHLQFGDPGNPEVYWTFSEAVKGLADFSKYIGLPCVGGKVSFYNEDRRTGKAIKPSPVVGVLGFIERVQDIRSMKLEEGDELLITGITKDELGGSEYYEFVLSFNGGKVPKVDFELEKNAHNLALWSIRNGYAKSLHDCSSGGLVVALAEMAIKSNLGVEVDLSLVPRTCNRIDDVMFSESHSRFIISCDDKGKKKIFNKAKELRIDVGKIGVAKGSKFILMFRDKRVVEEELGLLMQAYENTIQRLMGEEN